MRSSHAHTYALLMRKKAMTMAVFWSFAIRPETHLTVGYQ
jgi:hypothetical protein